MEEEGQRALTDPRCFADPGGGGRDGKTAMTRRDGECVALDHHAIYAARTLDQEETVVAEGSEGIGKCQVTGTGECCDASGPAMLHFHSHELTGRVGRDVKIAVAPERDPVQAGPACRRAKAGTLPEYFKPRRARRESEDRWMRAVGDI